MSGWGQMAASDQSDQLDRARDAEKVGAVDLAAVQEQLGRLPRGVAAVAHRCPCGCPDVLRTEPRLPDGTRFQPPTT